MRYSLFIVGLIVSLALPAGVWAQTPEGNPDTNVPVRSVHKSGGRDGWVIGLDMFAGNGLEADASIAAGMGGQIGRMITPRLAVMLDTHGAAVGSSDVGGSNVSASVRVRALAAAAVQYWPTNRFWVRGGVGLGRVEGATTSVLIVPSASIEETKNGFGTTVATGFELYQGPLFAFDLHARYAGIRAGGENYSSLLFGLGFVWYP
jgi:hypothetical protein